MSPVAKPTTLASVLKAGYAALTTGCLIELLAWQS